MSTKRKVARSPSSSSTRSLADPAASPSRRKVQRGAVGVEQRDRHRDRQRLLARLARRRRGVLLQGEFVASRARVVATARDQFRRAGLAVPGKPRREVAPVGVAERGEEVLDRRGAAVVTLEIKIDAAPEAVAAKHGGEHAHDLGALLVDRRGVEVVDLAVALRAHRVRERAGVLGNCARQSVRTSSIRRSVREARSDSNSCSR